MDDVIETGAVTNAAPVEPPASTSTPEPQTIAGGAKPDTVAQAPPPDWPSDWREKASKAVGDDPKFLEKLKTMGSPADLAKSYRELEKWKDSSKRIPELPEKATDAQIAEYRKAIGVPETPDKYNFDLGNGYVWGDADKADLEDFSKFAHDANMPERYAKTAVAYKALYDRKVKEEYAAKDKALLHESTQHLLREWGSDYDVNANAAGLFTNRNGLYDKLMRSRAPDGKILGLDPEMLNFYASIEKMLNPAATLLPAAGGDSSKTVEDQWSDAMDVRRNDPDKYWSGGFQKKVKQLAEAKAVMESRSRKSA